MTTTHKLKSWPEFFKDVECGLKTFELRRNDRGFQVGDVIVLQEWEPRTEGFTGRECVRRICYLMDGSGNVGVIEPLKGLNLGYSILGLMETTLGRDVKAP